MDHILQSYDRSLKKYVFPMSYSANQAFKKKTERKEDLILYSSDMINENR